MLLKILNIVGAVIALLNTVAVFCALKVAGDADRRAEELLERDRLLLHQQSLFEDDYPNDEPETGGNDP